MLTCRVSLLAVLFTITVSAAVGPVTNLEISEATVSPNGNSRTMQVAGGTFPGPLIRGNKGDRFQINVLNHLKDSSMDKTISIHWHGILQEGTNYMDGMPFVTQCPIVPDKEFQYDFTASNQAGTYFYRAESSKQSNGGVVGPLIIYDPDDPHAALYDVDNESTVVMLSDYYDTNPLVLGSSYYKNGDVPVPDNGLVNGRLSSEFNLAPGKRYRLRVINSGAVAAFQFSIDKHMLTVIEADGVAIQPVTVQRLPINVGQRYSVIVHTNQTVDNYWMRAVMNTKCLFGNKAPDLVTKAIVRYGGASNTDPVSNDWGSEPWSAGCVDLALNLLKPLVVQDAPAADQQLILEITYSLSSSVENRGHISGVSWSPAAAPTLLQILSGTDNHQDIVPSGSAYPVKSRQVVEIVINNPTDDSQTFRLTGHIFFILGSGQGKYLPGQSPINTVNPSRRDTVTTDPKGYTVLRFVTNNPGIWALHSQNEWYMKIGLLTQFMYPANEIRAIQPSSAWSELCTIYQDYE